MEDICILALYQKQCWIQGVVLEGLIRALKLEDPPLPSPHSPRIVILYLYICRNIISPHPSLNCRNPTQEKSSEFNIDQEYWKSTAVFWKWMITISLSYCNRYKHWFCFNFSSCMGKGYIVSQTNIFQKGVCKFSAEILLRVHFFKF